MKRLKNKYVIRLYRRKGGNASGLFNERTEFLAKELAGPLAWHFVEDRTPYYVQAMSLDFALRHYFDHKPSPQDAPQQPQHPTTRKP